ncbi:MAG: nitroreductase family deazaflavin-dependent oxidoreductase [Acidimicrobiaceae bacterium]|nr:nitroreductase family deazaflavin-dependent oxidoreductase [Acidimicrobiaceae bacterium]
MPSDLTLKVMNGVHRLILSLSGGRLGWEAGNMPVLELTTTGRKSGKLRSVMLTSPIQEGKSILIVASRGGDDFHPAWYLNLVDNPQVQVKLKGEPTKTMTARTATPDERVRLWPIVEQKYKGYAGYQQRTDREIPLIFLD